MQDGGVTYEPLGISGFRARGKAGPNRGQTGRVQNKEVELQAKGN